MQDVDTNFVALNRKIVECVKQGLQVRDDLVDFMSFYQGCWK